MGCSAGGMGSSVVKLWVANTDHDWFDFLAGQPGIDEVNFWQPRGNIEFGAVQPGELFLFKLKSPRNAVGGFGVFSQASNLPVSLAWDAFGSKNGVHSLSEMRERIGKYRSDVPPGADFTIGCRVVVQPVFLPESLWIEQPESWARSIVVGKTYDTESSEGRRLWDRLMEVSNALSAIRTGSNSVLREERSIFLGDGRRYGEPRLIKPRLGQGAFRLAVTDAYKRQCAVTGGRVLPALDAAHIQSFESGGEHSVSNGILLRKDIHCVFDAGYITFDEDLRMVVSDRVRTDFNNGNEYRRLHGQKLFVPAPAWAQPDHAKLEWHRSERFLDSISA
jgi:putative restriction endonuclease